MTTAAVEGLPPLPEPSAYAPQMITEDAFTAAQMIDYARSALAAPADSAPVAWRIDWPDEDDPTPLLTEDRSDYETAVQRGWKIVPLYAAPRAPAPDADLTDLAHEALSAAESAAHDLAGPQQRKEDKEARRALFDAIDARAPAPDAGTEALRDALVACLPFIDDAMDVQAVYSDSAASTACRKAVAQARAALSAADQGVKT